MQVRMDKARCLVLFEATRLIAEGEELSFCYGASYWLSDWF